MACTFGIFALTLQPDKQNNNNLNLAATAIRHEDNESDIQRTHRKTTHGWRRDLYQRPCRRPSHERWCGV